MNAEPRVRAEASGHCGPEITEPDAPHALLARSVVAALIAAGQSVASAESLTGGLVVAALIDVAGASAAVRGGIVAYHDDLKADLVGVDRDLLARAGAVQQEVAEQLATGAAERFRATWGVGTTGVAGPEPADGQPVGTVYIAVAGPSAQVTARRLALAGTRAQIRAAAVQEVLELLRDRMARAIPHRLDPCGAPGRRQLS